MLGKGTPSRRLRDTPVIRCPLPQTPSPANPLLMGKSVTYVSGTKCYLCLRSLIRSSPETWVNTMYRPHGASPDCSVRAKRILILDTSSALMERTAFFSVD